MERGLVHGPEVPQEYEDLVLPHLDSMNYFYTEGMQAVVDNLKPFDVSEYARACISTKFPGGGWWDA
jgi:hypothetical protein